ncbi:hypothetical protein IQ07DRAFT_638548 [Pyrenochaeta sp. DS3sAY3a]|nr:hypothetical protein IQ07DRAFT_638548 [Pyrenochaeta sp. DS3sAY3a]
METTWDFEHGTLAAPAATITQFIYEYNDITSTCIGNELVCDIISNPLRPAPATTASPTPTPHPSGTYIPPPSHATTHFDPGPSCIADESKWLVSTACNLGSDLPGWVECAITMTGNPRTKRWGACNPYRSIIDESSSTTWLDQCPVGYTVADSSSFRPFDSVQWSYDGTRSSMSTVSYDVVYSYARCCPEGDVSFSYWSGDDGVYQTTTVHPESGTAVASLWIPPRCIAAHATALADKDIVLTMINNDIIQEKRKRQDDSDNRPILGTTTRKWDVDQAIMFAEPAEYGYTVFHKTYTCFESCYEYFSNSYGNTDPNYTPTPTPTSPVTSKLSTGGPGSGPSGTNAESRETPASNSAVLSLNGVSRILVVSCIIAAATLF